MTSRSRNARTLRVAALVAIGLSAAAYAYALLKSGPTQFDDAYMFLRYANNILAGHGHAWNPDGMQVYGSTSLLHVAVVTLLKGCLPRCSDATVLLAASALPGILMLIVLTVAAAHGSTHRLLRRQYVLWAGVLFPTLIFNGVVLYHHRTGMDTMLAALCNALLILFAVRMARRCTIASVVPVVLLAYLSFLARPDNGLYATVFPVLCLLLCGTQSRWKLAGIFLTSIGMVLAVDFIAKWAVFDTPLPLAFYAKQHGVYTDCGDAEGRNPFEYLRVFLASAAPFVCIVVLLVRRESMLKLAALLLPVGLTLGYYFTVNQIMGAAARFYLPSLPFLVIAAAVVIDDQMKASHRGRVLGSREMLLRLTVGLLVLAVGRQTLVHAAAWHNARLPEVSTVVDQTWYETTADEKLPSPDRWVVIEEMARLARRAPQGTVMALSEHGLVGASAPHVALIDVVSLHDTRFAMEGFSAKELFRRKPDLIWLPHTNYPRLVRAVVESDAFRRDYLYYPDAFHFGIALRKDGPHFDALHESLAESWRAVYGDREMADYQAVPID